MRILILLGGLIFLSYFSFGQKPKYVYVGMPDSDDTLAIKDIHGWLAESASAYNGVYHFGESEGEVEMLVIAYDSGMVVQVFSNDWGKVDNYKGDTWRKKAEVFRAPKLTGNKFVSGNNAVHFVTYGKEKGILWGAGRDKPVTDTMEYGARTDTDLTKFWFFRKGDYPELSCKIQSSDYFKDRTKEQLQVMRNEIYARYGQRFIKTGAMYGWFSTKKWYMPFRDNVQDCLTAIELRNIETIKQFEKIDK